MKRSLIGIVLALAMVFACATMFAQTLQTTQQPDPHVQKDNADIAGFTQQAPEMYTFLSKVRAEAEKVKKTSNNKALQAKLDELLADIATLEAKAKLLGEAIAKFQNASPAGKEAAHTAYHTAYKEAWDARIKFGTLFSELQGN